MERRKIPEHVRQVVLLQAGYRCANPTCRHILTLELHHIVWVKDGGGNQPDNLLVLCPNCHSLHTQGHIPVQAILVWKSILTSLGNPNRGVADLLLILAEEEERVAKEPDPGKTAPPFRFTGDSLPALAPLLASKLIEISRRFLGANAWGGGHPSFEVSLTERGRQLVIAWRSGNPESLRDVLARKS